MTNSFHDKGSYTIRIACIEHKCPYCDTLIEAKDLSYKTDGIKPFPGFDDWVHYVGFKAWTFFTSISIGCKACKNWWKIHIDIAQNELHEDDRYYD
jgi:hypothetical protein